MQSMPIPHQQFWSFAESLITAQCADIIKENTVEII